MSNIRDEIKKLNTDQLISLHDYVGKLIADKKSEKKLTVWTVGDQWVNYEFFRNNEYLQAVEYFAKKAREIDSDEHSRLHDREMRITADRVPESEYESYFEDK